MYSHVTGFSGPPMLDYVGAVFQMVTLVFNNEGKCTGAINWIF